MLVRLPSFSGAAAAGMKNTSVLISAGGGPLGSFFQKTALSVSNQSSTTSQSRLRSPARWRPRVGPAAGGVLAEEEVALHLALGHAIEVRQLRVVAVDPRQPGEAEVVLRRRGVAVPGLEQADDELAEVGPVAGGQPLVLDVGVERLVLLVGGRLRQVAGQHVVQGREVGRALDAWSGPASP